MAAATMNTDDSARRRVHTDMISLPINYYWDLVDGSSGDNVADMKCGCKWRQSQLK
jgi:hypothetical protein